MAQFRVDRHDGDTLVVDAFRLVAADGELLFQAPDRHRWWENPAPRQRGGGQRGAAPRDRAQRVDPPGGGTTGLPARPPRLSAAGALQPAAGRAEAVGNLPLR